MSNIGMEVTVSEYRNGNSKENSVRKITGLNKATDVTMKRGVIGSLNLYQWLNDIRNGNQNAERTVVDLTCRTKITRRSCKPGNCCGHGSSSTLVAHSTPKAPTWRWKN